MEYFPLTQGLLLALSVTGAGLLSRTPESEAPPRRAHHSMAYDAARQRVILTGGSTPIDGGRNFVFFNDLWSFDGARWTKVAETGEKMSGSQLAYDTNRKRVVSFGGFAGASLDAVRVLVGEEWQTIGHHPAMPAAEPGFVYDTRRDRFVAFGGSDGPGRVHGDTWEFDGTAWRNAEVAGPAARQAHVMVFDSRRGKTVVFGGALPAERGQPPGALGDTWESDGQAWSERRVAGPAPRQAPGAAFDSRRGLVVIFGGLGSEGFLGDTWGWDGATWKKLADSGPPPRAMGYLAYDSRRDRVVLFGGRKGYPNGDLNDTWEWDGTSWHQVGE